MQVFTAAPHGDLLKLLFQITLLLATARLCGEIARRLGQPSVLGELFAGIVLGPSCLGALFPGFREVLLPQTPVEGYLLEVVSLFGALLLLLATGLETDAALIRRQARVGLGVALGGLALPLACGFVLGELLPDHLLASGGDRLVFSLFVATAMSISAIPVIAKILVDLDLMRRDLGQTIVAAAMVDDTTGWILLSIVAQLARGEAVTAFGVVGAVASVAGFLLVSFTLGGWLARRAVELVERTGGGDDRMLTLVVVLGFAWATFTHWLRLEPVLGAFVMGILVGRVARVLEAVRGTISGMALGVFAPIFFAVAGLKMNALALLRPDLFTVTLVVILTATASKVIGAYAGARLIGGRDHWTALAYGAGLNARGAVGIVVATIGLSLGILTQDMFSIIVVTAMATSLMAPAALRWSVRHIDGLKARPGFA